MPIFVHILFWGFALITIVGFLIWVLYSWGGGVFADEFTDAIKAANRPDPSNSNQRNGNFWYRHAELFGLLMAIGFTFGWVLWVAFAIQVASWIYGWGV